MDQRAGALTEIPFWNPGVVFPAIAMTAPTLANSLLVSILRESG
jgi:hypothetical protein